MASLTFISACDGISAVRVAWKQLGWKCVWVSEIEPFCNAVCEHHYPGQVNLGDMTTITENQVGTYGAVELMVGGTPCQSFSVAGLRKGLDDARGNLSLRFLQLLGVTGAKWVVWENVPGVLSIDEGRAFGTFLGALAKLGYGWAYRILDAQYVRVDGFGRAVPQRRRRVFVVGHLGDWRRAAAVLFERSCLSWDSPPSRKAGAGTTGTVGPLTSCGGTERKHGYGSGQQEIEAGHVVAYGRNNTSGPIDTAGACNAKGGAGRMDFETETFVTAHQNTGQGWWNEGPVAQAIRTPKGSGSLEANVVAFAERTRDGERQIESQKDIAYSINNPGQGRRRQENCVAWSVQAVNANIEHAHAIETDVARCLDGAGVTASQGGTAIQTRMAVRRLTPRECERLQGFPDDYTLAPYRGKPAKDGPRYRALGNAMAVNVMRWLGRRIEMVEDIGRCLAEATDGHERTGD